MKVKKHHVKMTGIVTGIVSGAILLVILLSSAFLNLNFILGNDVLIDLKANKESFSLVHGQSDEVEFTASIKTNPFCDAYCSYTFTDISNNKIINEESFLLQAAMDHKQTFAITPDHGTGSKLYRFNMKCLSNETFWCKTNEDTTSRNIILVADYSINETEKIIKSESKTEIHLLIEKVINLLNQAQTLDETAILINKELIIEHELLIPKIQRTISEINITAQDWNRENYMDLDTSRADYILQENEKEISETKQSLSSIILRYNTILENIESLNEKLILNESIIENGSILSEINNSIISLNQKLIVLERRESIEEKEMELNEPIMFIESSIKSIKSSSNIIKVTRAYELNKNYNYICNTTNQCYGPIQLDEVCNNIDFHNGLILELNLTNTANLTLVKPCKQFTPQFENVSTINITELDFAKTEILNVNISIEEPKAQCCVKNHCKPCQKMNNPSPIIFLHGHAFNEEVNPDYSLDTFEEFTKRLEEEYGIINFGRISLYNYPDLSNNLWGKFGIPISIKTSYYFDIYTEADNNVIVATNNENIDTYAIRFKDTIDTIIDATNSDKAIIIAHSMGGLVTRRYIQIFGTDNVEKVILVTVPNNGTYGKVADLCPLFGEELECRDMKAGSLFLNKLNSESLPEIPLTNIVGTGCYENDDNGDGIVFEKSATLNQIDNIIINGTCKGTSYFHTQIVNPEKYPDAYEIIASAITS